MSGPWGVVVGRGRGMGVGSREGWGGWLGCGMGFEKARERARKEGGKEATRRHNQGLC